MQTAGVAFLSERRRTRFARRHPLLHASPNRLLQSSRRGLSPDFRLRMLLPETMAYLTLHRDECFWDSVDDEDADDEDLEGEDD